MGRKKKQGGHKPAKFRMSDDERAAVGWCRTRGLYLLIEGGGANRQWTVYRLADGKEVGRYSPVTKEVRRMAGSSTQGSPTWVKLVASSKIDPGQVNPWLESLEWMTGA